MQERASGILLPLFSLPGPYGIGGLGREAFAFVDFLHSAKQRYWQLLPIGPTSYGDSPYQSYSSFAGNPYFIDLEALAERGLLSEAELAAARRPQGDIDYGGLYTSRFPLLRLAYERARAQGEMAREREFLEKERHWLPEYALFMALKDHYGGAPWWEWEEEYRLRVPEALGRFVSANGAALGFHVFLQAEFYGQWEKLRAYAKAREVALIGDLPIYVPRDSAAFWAERENFQADAAGTPRAVAGVPPDYFNADGQLWGNPLYDWEKMEEDGFAWWLRRIEGCRRLFDVLRIDHFRGLASYWRVPFGAPTAREGEWVEGPGKAFIDALHARFPDFPIIAEDLGLLDEGVRELLAYSGYPGMKVLQFAFSADGKSDYLPHCHVPGCVCYTGTHDNNTLRAWFDEISPEDAAFARDYLGLNEREGFCRGMLRAGMGSVAKLFIACMQDYLEYGGEGRINLPGRPWGNWRCRIEQNACTEELARDIAAMTLRYGRGE